MKLKFQSPGERTVLASSLGLAASASEEEIGAAVARRLTDTVPASTTAPAPNPASTTDPDAEAVIAQAVRDGKFAAERADHYRERWTRDPVGTRRVIARLRPGVVQPTTLAAATRPNADAYPSEWLRSAPGLSDGARIHGSGD
jgi:hypothetical protein